MDNITDIYFSEVREIAQQIDGKTIDAMVERLVQLRKEGGRLFIIGVGGSAANASHAANDFRKLCGIETYAPADNVSELTARTNDDGWETIFSSWLKVSKTNEKDVLLIFSVGGGNREKNISPNLIAAIEESKRRKTAVLGIVGRDGGYTKKAGDIVLVIPPIYPDRITPHTEAFQAVVWHCLVSDPRLSIQKTKWESVTKVP